MQAEALAAVLASRETKNLNCFSAGSFGCSSPTGVVEAQRLMTYETATGGIAFPRQPAADRTCGLLHLSTTRCAAATQACGRLTGMTPGREVLLGRRLPPSVATPLSSLP